MREVETVKERCIDDLVPSKGCGTPAEENEWMFDARNDQERIDYMDVVAGESASYNELY